MDQVADDEKKIVPELAAVAALVVAYTPLVVDGALLLPQRAKRRRFMVFVVCLERLEQLGGIPGDCHVVVGSGRLTEWSGVVSVLNCNNG